MMRLNTIIMGFFAGLLAITAMACSSSVNTPQGNSGENVKTAGAKADPPPETKGPAVTIADGRDENEPPKPLSTGDWWKDSFGDTPRSSRRRYFAQVKI